MLSCCVWLASAYIQFQILIQIHAIQQYFQNELFERAKLIKYLQTVNKLATIANR